MKWSLWLLLFSLPIAAWADVFATAATRYGLDPSLLRAIAEVESAHNPWALNINGISCQEKGDPFLVNGRWRFCDTRENAIAILLYASNNPWLLTAEGPNNTQLRIFMPSNERAEHLAAHNRLQNTHIEKKNILSTDIGLMQINWRSHGDNIRDASKLFEPAYNVDYGARFLADLIRRNGREKAIGMYHTGERGSPARQERYREMVLARYGR